ncbi:MAG: S8 family serine peptidase [Wenzhouxiangella sp.]
MKSFGSLLPSAACVIGLALAGQVQANGDRYIVQFAPGAAGNGKAEIQAIGGQIKVDMTNRSINAVSISIPGQALNALQNNPNIISIEPDGRVYPMADEVPYGITMVQADLVSDQFAGNQKVCVIDSGYHIDHNDLQDFNVTASFLSGSGDPFIDPCGHGTHVTGTISALANGSGVLGVLPGGNVGLHIVKVFGDNNWSSGSCGWSYTSSVIAAAYECADAGANIINMSLGGGSASTAAAQGFQDLLDQGVLSIAAAGNGGNTSLSYPASYDAVISVAAIDSNKNLASFSQRNSQVELAAPGVGVLSTTPFADAAVEVDRSYLASPMDRTARTTASGNLVDGGLCLSPGNWSGQVVLCQRGQVSFSDKINAVQAGGGVAAVVYNNEPGGFGGQLQCSGNPNRPCSSIPAVTMSQEDGQTLVASQLGSSAFVSTISTVPANGYAAWNGTSMASPHVAAVAALVWSHAPELTATEVRAVLAATAQDLGTSGRNNEFGYGLVQAKAALDYIGGGTVPGPEPEPEPEPNQPPTAAFSYSCDELACSFDGSTSSDSDGEIVSYQWSFGDGVSATGISASHSYLNDGSYTVTLSVTDDDGAGDTTSKLVTVAAATPEPEPEPEPEPGDISLTADGYKVQGRWRTDLSWSGAQGSSVDIYRDGSLLTTVSNSGSYTDATNLRGGGTLTYQICEAGTSNCSDSATAFF